MVREKEDREVVAIVIAHIATRVSVNRPHLFRQLLQRLHRRGGPLRGSMWGEGAW